MVLCFVPTGRSVPHSHPANCCCCTNGPQRRLAIPELESVALRYYEKALSDALRRSIQLSPETLYWFLCVIFPHPFSSEWNNIVLICFFPSAAGAEVSIHQVLPVRGPLLADCPGLPGPPYRSRPPTAGGCSQRWIWVACCIGFFGFLRAGEFTVPSLKEYDSTIHLSLADIALDSHSAPTLLRVHIKASKSDSFRKGVDLFLGKTASSICHITAMTAFLLQRSPASGPLFTLQDGSTLSRACLVTAVRSCLRAGGVNEEAYSGHSFRIGAATTAAKKGIEDSMIQVLGRWQSAAYLRYVRIPRENLAAVSSVLVS